MPMRQVGITFCLEEYLRRFSSIADDSLRIDSVGVEDLSGSGQHDAAGYPCKQRDAKFRLQLFDRGGNGLAADEQIVSGFADGLIAAGFNKMEKLFEGHNDILLQWI